ncbi:MAG: zinc-ribbon domain-containing protein [Chloroflexi bacterium]|nr:MAG: zinc-ribbon domain-containing protein [Chloroflexota bacterium]
MKTLPLICPKCGAAHESAARFCSACGSALVASESFGTPIHGALRSGADRLGRVLATLIAVALLVQASAAILRADSFADPLNRWLSAVAFVTLPMALWGLLLWVASQGRSGNAGRILSQSAVASGVGRLAAVLAGLGLLFLISGVVISSAQLEATPPRTFTALILIAAPAVFWWVVMWPRWSDPTAVGTQTAIGRHRMLRRFGAACRALISLVLASVAAFVGSVAFMLLSAALADFLHLDAWIARTMSIAPVPTAFWGFFVWLWPRLYRETTKRGERVIAETHRRGYVATTASGARQLLVALLAGAVFFLASNVVAYFGRVDIAFGQWIQPATILPGLVGFVVFLRWPRLYRPVFRSRTRAVVAITVALALVPGQLYALENYDRGPGIELRQAASLMISHTSPSAAAQLFAVRQEFWPFHPLSIKPDAGTAFEFTTRANTYLFFVDETPGLRFAHTVRYVFVDERGDITTREEESLPSVNGLHWEFDQEIIVDGRVLTVLRDAREAPAPVEPVARTGPDDPAVKRLALLIDGGEARPAWIDSQSARHNAITKKFGEDADAFGAMLAREGFETRRGASRIDLAAEIHRIATETLPGSDVVLYFSADGGAEGMTLYGSGTLIGYRELAVWLDEIDPRVKLTVILDVSQSAGAIPYLIQRANTVVVSAAGNDLATPIGIGPEDESFTSRALAAYKTAAADGNGDGLVDVREASTVAAGRHGHGASVTASDASPAIACEPMLWWVGDDPDVVLRRDAARWNQIADQLRRELAGKGLAEIDAVARSVDPCLRTTPVTAGSSVVSVTSQALYGPGIVTYPTGSGWRLYTFTRPDPDHARVQFSWGDVAVAPAGPYSIELLAVVRPESICRWNGFGCEVNPSPRSFHFARYRLGDTATLVWRSEDLIGEGRILSPTLLLASYADTPSRSASASHSLHFPAFDEFGYLVLGQALWKDGTVIARRDYPSLVDTVDHFLDAMQRGDVAGATRYATSASVVDGWAGTSDDLEPLDAPPGALDIELTEERYWEALPPEFRGSLPARTRFTWPITGGRLLLERVNTGWRVAAIVRTP